jgi:hypothetical protein
VAILTSRLLEKSRAEAAATSLDNSAKHFKLHRGLAHERLRSSVIDEILSLSTKKVEDRDKAATTLRVYSLRESMLETIALEAGIYQTIMRILTDLSAEDDDIGKSPSLCSLSS